MSILHDEAELAGLEKSYPHLEFMDRRNPRHLRRLDDHKKSGEKSGEVSRHGQPVDDKHLWLRFQASEKFAQRVELPSISGVRDEVNTIAEFNKLIAWSDSVSGLAALLEGRGE